MAESPLVSNEGKARPGLFRTGFVGLENGFVAGWPMPPSHGAAIGRLFGNGIRPVIGCPSGPTDARKFGNRLRIASAACW